MKRFLSAYTLLLCGLFLTLSASAQIIPSELFTNLAPRINQTVIEYGELHCLGYGGDCTQNGPYSNLQGMSSSANNRLSNKGFNYFSTDASSGGLNISVMSPDGKFSTVAHFAASISCDTSGPTTTTITFTIKYIEGLWFNQANGSLYAVTSANKNTWTLLNGTVATCTNGQVSYGPPYQYTQELWTTNTLIKLSGPGLQ